ncbi:MAG: glycosyltransferase, partial [Thermodesulfobacteriota bacterium]
MKILIFIQNLKMGGVIRQLSYLAPRLKKKGHDVSILALYESNRDWEHMLDEESVRINTLIARKPENIFMRIVGAIRATLELRRILMKERVQILYSFSGHNARLMSWFAVNTVSGTKLVWGVQGSSRASLPGARSHRDSIVFHINKRLSPFVPLLIANSRTGLASRVKRGYRCAKGLVIDNGFDTDKFRPDPEARERLRGEWDVSGNETLIGIIARLDPVKGHITFLEACSLLLKDRCAVRFVCIGNGSKSYRYKLELLSRDLGIGDYLIWAGAKEDISSVLNSLDVLCSSSYREGFPNVIGEAMACGVPCVVTDAGD